MADSMSYVSMDNSDMSGVSGVSGVSNSRTRLDLTVLFHKARDVSKGLHGDDSFLYVDVHPREPWVIFIEQCRSIQVWDCAQQTMITSWNIDEQLGPWDAVKFLERHGGLFIVLSNRNSILMRRVNTSNFEWDLIKQFQPHKCSMHDMVIHPNSSYLMTFSEKSSKLWNWNAGWAVKSFRSPAGARVTAVALHPHDRRVVFANAYSDNKIRVWSAENKSILYTVTSDHQTTVLQFYTKRQSPLLIAGTSEGTVEVWDYEKSRLAAELTGLDRSVCAVFAHPRLPYIFAASEFGMICAWAESTYQPVMAHSSVLTEICSMAACESTSCDMLVIGGRREFALLEIIIETQPDLLPRSHIPESLEQLLRQAVTREAHAQQMLSEAIELRNKIMNKQADTIRQLEGETCMLERRISLLENSSQGSRKLDAGDIPWQVYPAENLQVGGQSRVVAADHQSNGGFECGQLRQVVPVQMKRLAVRNLSTLLDKDLVDKLTSLKHPHLLRFLGVCNEQNCLIYEPMANGSVKDCVSPQEGSGAAAARLPWFDRLRIMSEVAQALFFLHADTSATGRPIIHGCINPSNILLDKDFVSKISSIDSVITLRQQAEIGQTPGIRLPLGTSIEHIAPEYFSKRKCDEKTDVFALGVTFLEMLTGRLGSQSAGSANVAEMMEEVVNDDMAFRNALDHRAGLWDVDLAREVARLAMKCASIDKRCRPASDAILDVLNGIAARVRPGNSALVTA
ncbi:hypothetical protein CBR_g34796 [Chara braunii]|uniref:Protein kinase domain-containing protein n=1 Tax=Chara braunii TaxID=69332 RepID=A0A388LJB5_CHABU|nr:hypothetical protein CBR_g34796 [Chara braunii]|eukprot:GBG82420.1 hypothetical protein CBR_g34796 [Chara braunii]